MNLKTLSSRGVDAHPLFCFADPLEFHDAVNEGEQSIIAADAYISPRVNLGAALANKDAACAYNLTAKSLDAETLCITITTVA